jgi:hypothetical protein
MTGFNTIDHRLELTPDELRALARLATGDLAPDDVPHGWVDAGLVADGAVHPVAAAMALVAIAPERAVAIERLAGDSIVPLMVGWHRSGRATLTEHVPSDDGDGRLVVTATHVELLPALLMQAIGLQPDQPPASRPPIETTAGVIDDAIVELAQGGVVAALAAPDDLLAVLDHGELVMRATGSWQGDLADASVTLLMAGHEGVWMIERDTTTRSRETEVRLRPTDVATAVARLGDVVTGRTAPRRHAA